MSWLMRGWDGLGEVNLHYFSLGGDILVKVRLSYVSLDWSRLV
jgi:hypothetical protein